MSWDGVEWFALLLESLTVDVAGFHKLLCAVNHLGRSPPAKHKLLVLAQDTSLTGCGHT